ncbi:MAG TPA: L-threonylcarbamoyladenylate synthase [bacterium]|nr:L-threonylcarbamoyladenylate synthase [bacterium]
MRTTTAAATDRQALAAYLRQGGIAAVPTDTVYGLIAVAGNDAAAQRIYALKGRPDDKKLILLAGDRATVARNATIAGTARTLAERYWPGPLTLVLPVPGGAPTGFRVPDHDWLCGLLRVLAAPVVSTSANLSDRPPATTAAEVRGYFPDADFWLVDGGPAPGGMPSTVLDGTLDPPRVLRPGPILL